MDQVNTLPFLTPLFRKDSLVLFQQLAREVWFYEAPFPVSVLGYLAEPLYLQLYRARRIITISQSSLASLRKAGLNGPATIIPISVDEPPIDLINETFGEDIIVLGRLARSKRIEHSIAAAAMLAARGWKGRLRIIGSGEKRYTDRLVKRARAKLGAQVVFHGRVSADERRKLLTEAGLLWMTSVREGWGLVVTEAGRRGTPSIVYDVPGLRDSVTDGVTGFVVETNPSVLASMTAALFRNRALREATRAAAHERSKAFTVPNASLAFERAILDSS